MTLTVFNLILGVWIVTAPFLGLLWLQQRARQNAVMADVGFCLGLTLVLTGYAVWSEGDVIRRMVVAAMGGIYAVRLGIHLLVNRVLGKLEDARYRTLRQRLGTRAQAFFFLYFQGQALAIVVFSLPFLVLMRNPSSTFSWWEVLGFLVWLTAILGEALADYQLTQFRANPRNAGKVYRGGLWGYSRHPNYFFEGIHWCAYVLMGIGIPYGWVTLVGPILMIGALLKVSGIPLAEAQAVAGRGEAYRDYQRTTNAFIPWFPKKSH